MQCIRTASALGGIDYSTTIVLKPTLHSIHVAYS